MSNQQRQGRPLTVITNSFPITRLPTKEYHQYDVVFEPEQKVPRRRQEIMHELQVQYPQFFNPRFAYDGNAILYASRVLDFGGSSGATLVVNLGGGGSRQGGASAGRPGGKPPRGVIQVRLTRTQAESIKPLHLNNLIQRQGSVPTMQTATATNLLQLIIRQGQNWNKYPSNARAYFTDVGKLEIGGGFELWRGFFQSVRPSIGKMLVNIDISMAAMYQSGNVLNVALSVLGKREVRDLVLDARSPDFRRLEKYFKKRLITVDSPSMKGRKKTIYGLEPRGGRFLFTLQEGVETTVMDYFQSQFGIRMKLPDVFGIVVSNKNAPNKAIVPAELCTVIPGQLYKGKIPEEIQSGAVQKFSTMKPSDRLKAIQTGVIGNQQLEGPAQQYKQNDLIADAGMQINFQPLSIHGRVLDTPQLLYGQGSQPFRPRNGSWNVVDKRFHIAETMSVWSVVSLQPTIPTEVVQSFVIKLQECCRKLGMQVSNTPLIASGNPQAPEKELNNSLGQMLEYMKDRKLKPKNLVIIVILPQSAAAVRARVKYWGDVENGVVTQCVREPKVWSRGRPAFNDQYCNNVALKLNARLGGVNSITRSQAIEKLKMQPYMVMGADVGHPGPGTTDRPSITSLVFSHDIDASLYAAMSRVQPPRQEMIIDLKEMVSQAVQAFGQKNRAAPAAIIFFRDGVSEGEYEEVAKNEIRAIREGIDHAWTMAGATQPKPSLTFIVVGKRHHVRFFPPRGEEDRSGNCPAGFVADVGIQSPFCSDFYLLSHGGLIGTSKPSHYIVLLDENFHNNIDELQSLAFTLCHVYAKATRSVSIPAPVYYADLVCSRAAFYFDENLDYTGSDSATVASGGRVPFNLDLWKEGYRGINRQLMRSMYFL